ncbi:hypothetical protein [Halobacillus amylolyticus]|uniref:Uncharacterized protein n=1 Tax=Halobacillus amylolyticus TaxID=2932259 RepID=A0ABY4HFX4_9BACI|nr:hypothetical protein [Halobacillus amylolyticus]UOR13811.1 hypothetical protein MUO15_10400 [Halobacillus amylolyticus]
MTTIQVPFGAGFQSSNRILIIPEEVPKYYDAWQELYAAILEQSLVN